MSDAALKANAGFPIAITALDAAPRTKPSNYPEPFASRMAGRDKRPLGISSVCRTSAST
jgi:hypothetical protein